MSKRLSLAVYIITLSALLVYLKAIGDTVFGGIMGGVILGYFGNRAYTDTKNKPTKLIDEV